MSARLSARGLGQRNDERGRISAMTIRFILLGLILSLTVDAQAQTFTRGQWTQWGTGSYSSAVTVGDGTIKDFQGNTIPAGTRVGEWGASESIDAVFGAWAQGGVWDLSRSQWIAGMANIGYPTFDLNIFDVPSGTWNPDGRPQRSYSEFVSAGHAQITFPANMSLFNNATSTPAAFVDVNNHYADVADINPTTGTRLLPNVGHHAGSLVWMPNVGRVAWTGSYGYYWSDNGVAPGVWEWDPVTKKWALDIQGTDASPDPQYNPPVCAVWDSRRNRVLSVTGAQTADGTLFAYDPAQAQGRRITRMFTNTLSVRVTGSGGGTGNPNCVYDPKRDQMRVYGSFPGNGLSGQYGVFSFSSGGEPRITLL